MKNVQNIGALLFSMLQNLLEDLPGNRVVVIMI